MTDKDLIKFLRWIAKNQPVSIEQIEGSFSIPFQLREQLVKNEILLRGYHEYSLGAEGLRLLLNEKSRIRELVNATADNVIALIALVIALVALFK